MKLHFSNHAFSRVKERLHLSSKKVLELIKKHKTVPIGMEKSSNRSHDLFFSIVDNCCFVAIRDVYDGTIVTIVPAEWHNKWRISIEAMTEAKRLASQGIKVSLGTHNGLPSKLKVKGFFDCKTTNLGSLEIATFQSAIVAAASPEAVEQIIKRLIEKDIPIKSIDKIAINNGGRSEFVGFSIIEENDMYTLRKI